MDTAELFISADGSHRRVLKGASSKPQRCHAKCVLAPHARVLSLLPFSPPCSITYTLQARSPTALIHMLCNYMHRVYSVITALSVGGVRTAHARHGERWQLGGNKIFACACNKTLSTRLQTLWKDANLSGHKVRLDPKKESTLRRALQPRQQHSGAPRGSADDLCHEYTRYRGNGQGRTPPPRWRW